MAFILAAERDRDAAAAFDRYREYLDRHRDRFPKNAYALATSDWYYDPREHRCPHDAWLESATLLESGSHSRSLSLVVKLLGAFHDGYIVIRYPRLFGYRFEAKNAEVSHLDWRYDELRVDADGRLEHEIEWSGRSETGRWLVVASDVELEWVERSPA